MSALLSGSHGHRLLNAVVEEQANLGHVQPYASLPKTNNPKDGFRDITYGLLKTAIDKCAWFLDDRAGCAHHFETIGYMSLPTDFRYLILAFAAMKTGHKVFYTSPRNSLDAHLALLEECQCNVFLEPEEGSPQIVAVIAQHRPMRMLQIPELNYFLDTESAIPHYPFNKSFEEARLDPCIVLHTSGSTGIPKAVFINHGWFAVVDGYHNMPKLGAEPMGISRFQNTRCFLPFPNFHSAATILYHATAIYWNVTIVAAPIAPLTAELADSYLLHANIDTAILPPSVLKDIAQDQSILEHLGRIKYLGYAGSPLPFEVGEVISKYTFTVNVIGITETSMLPFETTERSEWAYLRFGPHTGVEFRHANGNQYEMVLVRNAKLDYLQGVFLTFPDINEWPTKDLYSKHPSKADHWHYECRADDIIVFNNGEKVNPLTMQQAISNHPDIAGALVAGSGRFQSSLILEPLKPVKSAVDREALVEKVWPTIQRANEECVAHGRVDRDFILFTDPGRPFLRAGKGTIQRNLSIQLYKDEIEALYKAMSAVEPSSVQVDLSDASSVRSSLRAVISATAGSEPLADDADFFTHGVDSVHVIRLVRFVNKALGGSVITSQGVYSNGSINRLTDLVMKHKDLGNQEPEMNRIANMNHIFDKYASDIPISARVVSNSTEVILTGSTGSLGSYILHRLLETPSIHHIHCFNRTVDAKDRQTHINAERGLTSDLTNPRLTFHHADLSAPYFGLPLPTYRHLLHRTTLIIHNAWPVDFNLRLSSFADTHIYGVRQLIDFSLHSARGARIYFLSSMGTVQNWRPTEPTKAPHAPEAPFTDWDVSPTMGYAEAKHISERLLSVAAERSGVPATFCRVGQIGGPVQRGAKGMWGKQEWLPSIIISARHLGVLPMHLGPMDDVDWVPVDALAGVLVGLALAGSVADEGKVEVHHVVNPRKVAWSKTLAPVVQARLGDVEGVTFVGWVEALRKSASHPDGDVERNPAVKLLPFFEMLEMVAKKDGELRAVTLNTTETQKISGELRGLEAVCGNWVELWMRQWGL